MALLAGGALPVGMAQPVGIVSAALATNLVPALIERGLSPTTAAAFGGLFGVMQCPGRFLFVHHNRSVNPMMVLAGSLGLQVTVRPGRPRLLRWRPWLVYGGACRKVGKSLLDVTHN